MLDCTSPQPMGLPFFFLVCGIDGGKPSEFRQASLAHIMDKYAMSKTPRIAVMTLMPGPALTL